MSSPTDRVGGRRNSSGLTRDLELLEVLSSEEAARAGGLGVVRVAELAGRDKAVVSRSLATLAEVGLLERDPATLAYRVGSRIYSLAAITAEATLAREGRAAVQRIAQMTRETTHLCVLRGGNVLTILSELSPHEFRSTGWEGVTTAAWRTPSGRVLLSDWDEGALRAWYAEHGHDRVILGPLNPAMQAPGFSLLEEPPRDKARVTDFDSLLREIAVINGRGYALLEEEMEAGVVGASAPVTNYAGRVIAAINVSGPALRVGKQLDALGVHVARAAAELSAKIGGQARPA